MDVNGWWVYFMENPSACFFPHVPRPHKCGLRGVPRSQSSESGGFCTARGGQPETGGRGASPWDPWF